MLAALGVTVVPVYRRPRVAIISTGDEIVPVATASLPAGKVRDINSYVLAAQVQEAGGLCSLQTDCHGRSAGTGNSVPGGVGGP